MKKYCTIFLIVFVLKNFLFPMIQIYPPKQEVVASPEDKIIGNIWVNNPTNEILEVQIMPEDWTFGKQSKEITWLKITKPKKLKFKLKPGKTKEVKYKAVIPKDAKGTLTAQIFFLGLPVKNKEKISIVARIASGLFITIKDTEVVDVKIEKFDFIIREDKSLDFIVTLKNNGNIRLKVEKGEFEIRDLNDEIKFSHNFQEWVLPANNSWNFYVGRNEKIVLEKGEYKAKVKFYLNNHVLKEPVVIEEEKFFSIE